MIHPEERERCGIGCWGVLDGPPFMEEKGAIVSQTNIGNVLNNEKHWDRGGRF